MLILLTWIGQKIKISCYLERILILEPDERFLRSLFFLKIREGGNKGEKRREKKKEKEGGGGGGERKEERER